MKELRRRPALDVPAVFAMHYARKYTVQPCHHFVPPGATAPMYGVGSDERARLRLDLARERRQTAGRDRRAGGRREVERRRRRSARQPFAGMRDEQRRRRRRC